MAYLYLIRHGQPDFIGNYDSLTPLGVQQSQWLGEHFAARGMRPTRVVCGDLRRQIDTCQNLLAALPDAPAPRIDPRLNEYDARGLLRAFASSDDQMLRGRNDRKAYFTAVREALRTWSSVSGHPSGIESWADFGNRVMGALQEHTADLQRDDTLVVVTSGGVIGRAVAMALGADAEVAIQLNLQTRNTGVTELAVGRSGLRLTAFNGVPHLERPDRIAALTHS